MLPWSSAERSVCLRAPAIILADNLMHALSTETGGACDVAERLAGRSGEEYRPGSSTCTSPARSDYRWIIDAAVILEAETSYSPLAPSEPVQ